LIAASQYTYFYHILQLHLNTQLPITRSLTSSLLDNMLHPTMLFEHDPSELSVWISAIPKAHSTVSGPLLTVQQIYLLSFLDDCFKRAQQFPYRYIEQLTTLVPEYFSWSNSSRVVSCVLMAVLEQFHAKMVGQHLSTDAAVVILGYLRRVLLGLMGKMDDDKFLEAVMLQLDATVAAAKEKGQDRPGVETLIEAMRHDIKAVFHTTGGAYNEAADFPRLVDEQ
jgi:nucleolar pre-ribosomal-associated protein 1